MIPNSVSLTDDDWAMIRVALYAAAYASRNNGQTEQANLFSSIAAKLTPPPMDVLVMELTCD